MVREVHGLVVVGTIDERYGEDHYVGEIGVLSKNFAAVSAHTIGPVGLLLEGSVGVFGTHLAGFFPVFISTCLMEVVKSDRGLRFFQHRGLILIVEGLPIFLIGSCACGNVEVAKLCGGLFTFFLLLVELHESLHFREVFPE
eukprot:CAMPEP_0170543100 /NCGR_PEP_ID=MMETSP0211-20121228/2326_1 /TAXON_ID=311385 /ORGANISM="Pseudokeronopsis sp., Strain OXSARD2" /LENGTH=141 /DNA_ID=CAMNT_0010846387 /DNA_START=357 /DNA_END=779 /DNA_ORIENTATION=+